MKPPPKKHPKRKKTATLHGIMFGYQGHAWEDLRVKLGKIAKCHGHPPNQDDYKHIICPICTQAREYDDLSEDHAPQRGGQSSFGKFAIKVLTCREQCNNRANTTYESAVNTENERIQERPADLTGIDPCLIHGAGSGWYSDSGLIVPPSDDLRFLTDLKAGFLLGFAALGYRWAVSHELRPVREAIRSGNRPSNQHAVMTRLKPSERSVVMDVAPPFRSTIVRHKNGTALILPTVGASTVPITYQQMLEQRFAFGPVRVKRFPWPEQPETKKDVRDLFEEKGYLFHLDHCRLHIPGYFAITR